MNMANQQGQPQNQQQNKPQVNPATPQVIQRTPKEIALRLELNNTSEWLGKVANMLNSINNDTCKNLANSAKGLALALRKVVDAN